MQYLQLFLLAFSLILTGCGGGSSSVEPQSNEQIPNSGTPQKTKDWQFTQPQQIVLTGFTKLQFPLEVTGGDVSKFTYTALDFPAWVKLEIAENNLALVSFSASYLSNLNLTLKIEITDGDFTEIIEILVQIKEMPAKPSLVATDSTKTCTYTQGVIDCWGSVTIASLPKQVENVTKIAVSGNQVCWLANGQVACEDKFEHISPSDLTKLTSVADFDIAQNGMCVVNQGTVSCDFLTVPEKTANSKALSVVMGTSHACALVEGIDTSEVHCWGNNNSGQLNISQLNAPFELAAADDYSCALDMEGLSCWGNVNGAQALPETLTAPKQLVAGKYQACVIDEGQLKCWGQPNSIQQNFAVVEIVGQVASISSGIENTCLIDQEALKCWGSNNSLTSTPKGAFANIEKLSIGEQFICYQENSQVQCQGKKNYKQLNVPVGLANVDKLESGSFHTCALFDKKVNCWGEQFYGQGNVPQETQNANVITDIAAGSVHNCVIADNNVSCWGNNRKAQLDVPQTISSPYLIASGSYQTCAAHDGGLTCWGISIYEKSEAPRAFDTIELLSVGEEQICVKDSNGLTCWGSAYVKNLPTAMQNVTEVSAGGRNSCAIASGKLSCWGADPIWSYFLINQPKDLINPRLLKLNDDSACVVDDNGLHCWNEENNTNY